MRYRIELRAESPLAISRSRAAGNQILTASHIPGTSWRGAFAGEVMRRCRLTPQNAHNDVDFQALFLKGKVRFGDLRIRGDAPWPLSARTCARKSESHPVVDLLLLDSLQRKLPDQCASPGCGGKLTAPVGYYQRTTKGIEARQILSRVNAHTAISNRSLRVRPEQFFSTEVLERGQVFEGALITTDGPNRGKVCDERWNISRHWPGCDPRAGTCSHSGFPAATSCDCHASAAAQLERFVQGQ